MPRIFPCPVKDCDAIYRDDEAALAAHTAAVHPPWDFVTYGEETDSGESVDPLVPGILWPGAKHLIVSPPKVGKSFFSIALTAALRNHTPFLGRPTEPTKVLYLTEEPRDTFERKLDQFDIEEGDQGFRYLRYGMPGVFGRPWSEIAEKTHETATAIGAELVIVDVLHRWAGFRDEAENRSGPVSEAIGMTTPMAEDGIAVLILHHAPWNHKRARGSTDIWGAVDDGFFIGGTAGTDEARTLEWMGGRHEATARIAFRVDAGGHLEDMGGQTATAASKTSTVIGALEAMVEPGTTKQVADYLAWSERTARRWLDRALAHKLVAYEVGPRAEFIWRKRRRFEYLEEAGAV